jgi:peptidoglycan/LPS O-acetylase OafA/YrhL
MERSGLRGRLLATNFYIRRFFRIYPLSVVAIACALALHLDSNVNSIPGLSYGPRPGKLQILSQLLLVQNLVHVKSIVNVLWSLPFEVQMYVFLPLLYAWIRYQKRGAWWPLLVLWVVALGGALLQPHVGGLSRFSLLRFVPCFLPGIVAFALPHVPRLRSYLWPVFVLGLVAAFTLNPVLSMGCVLCLILGLAIPLFREIETRWVRTASNRIATYSYGIYISHQFCIWFALGVLAARPLWVRIGVLTTSLIILPVVLYHGLESPMIRVGIRLARSGGKKSVSAVEVEREPAAP